jgi:uncharacterized damage-inducible protein DinB
MPFSEETAMTLTERLIAELGQEAETTRRVLERVPPEKLSWTPHQKSQSLGQLAFHVAMIPGRIADLVDPPASELPVVPRPEAKSIEELTSALSASVARATEKLRGWGDEGLDLMFRLTRNGKTVLQMPRYNMIRSVMFNHWFHHRGQLTVYLRLLDVPVPSVYGGSADEAPPF